MLQMLYSSVRVNYHQLRIQELTDGVRWFFILYLQPPQLAQTASSMPAAHPSG